MASITLRPNAKINLGLFIRGRRPDGYHLLQTVFYPVPLFDTLTVGTCDSPACTLEITGPHAIPPAPDNLVLQAYDRLAARVGGLPPVRVVLEKRIPAGAGLGGGSSDAAHMLLALNQLFQLNLSQEQLRETALPLGADVPFFIENRPMLAEGIGEVLTPLPLDLQAYRMELVTPPIHSDTRAAYRHLQPADWSTEANLPERLQAPVSTWRDRVRNDFEPSVFRRFPQLADEKQRLYDRGAVYASMSGSGSALYGLFAKDNEEAAA